MSAISGYINQIQNAVYGEQVRSAIVNALRACYSDVENPDLQSAAFQEAIEAAYQDGILDIITVTSFDSMTNQNIIYRYNGTAAGKQKGLYYYSALAGDWVLVGSEIQTVSNSSYFTNTKAIYFYTGTQTGMKQNSLYFYNGTSWEPIGNDVETDTTLTISGAPADAKAVGDALKSENSYVFNASHNGVVPATNIDDGGTNYAFSSLYDADFDVSRDGGILNLAIKKNGTNWGAISFGAKKCTIKGSTFAPNVILGYSSSTILFFSMSSTSGEMCGALRTIPIGGSTATTVVGNLLPSGTATLQTSEATFEVTPSLLTIQRNNSTLLSLDISSYTSGYTMEVGTVYNKVNFSSTNALVYLYGSFVNTEALYLTSGGTWKDPLETVFSSLSNGAVPKAPKTDRDISITTVGSNVSTLATNVGRKIEVTITSQSGGWYGAFFGLKNGYIVPSASNTIAIGYNASSILCFTLSDTIKGRIQELAINGSTQTALIDNLLPNEAKLNDVPTRFTVDDSSLVIERTNGTSLTVDISSYTSGYTMELGVAYNGSSQTSVVADVYVPNPTNQILLSDGSWAINQKSHLTILIFGHSYTADSWQYVPFILKEYGITCEIYVYYRGNGSIDQLVNQWTDRGATGADSWGQLHMRRMFHIDTRISNSWDDKDGVQGYSAKDILEFANSQNFEWDIITLQTAPTEVYFTAAPGGTDPRKGYEPWVRKAIELIKASYTKPFKLGWFCSYTQIYPEHGITGAEFDNRVGCLRAAETIFHAEPFDFVIPAAAAVFNGRTNADLASTDVSAIGNLWYSDAVHLQQGVPCYITNLTVVETLFKMFYPWMSVRNDKTRITQQKITDWKAIVPSIHGNVLTTDEDLYKLAQKCAISAVQHPFEIVPIRDPDDTTELQFYSESDRFAADSLIDTSDITGEEITTPGSQA